MGNKEDVRALSTGLVTVERALPVLDFIILY